MRALSIHHGKPMALLADTVKGKGVSFMEDNAGWHGKAPNREEMIKGLNELGVADRIPVQKLLDKAQAYQDTIASSTGKCRNSIMIIGGIAP